MTPIFARHTRPCTGYASSITISTALGGHTLLKPPKTAKSERRGECYVNTGENFLTMHPAEWRLHLFHSESMQRWFCIL